MKRRRPAAATWAAASMAIVASVAPGITREAHAEVLARYPAGQWVVEANASNGAFQNCTMSPAAGSGAKIVLVMSRDGKWGIGVVNPAAKLSPGATNKLAYWVDDVIPRGATATAVDNLTMVAPLAASTQLFEEFRLGSMINVQLGGDTFHLSTNGTSAALAAVTSCVRRHGQQGPK